MSSDVISDSGLAARVAEFDRAVLDRDAALAEQVLHPDYALVLVQPVPASVPRASWLAMLPDYVVSRWEVEAVQVDLDVDVAAVLRSVRMDAVVLGEDRSGLFVLSDVWFDDDDAGWRVWKRHSTPLTAGRMPGSD